ncbi:MAG: F0F1 ATP synthase subunit gamma [Proteobacteria bacterium]|nr:F0F1 ATP synthase subunit gamma [Pseudomonadota bacterium]
MANLKDLRVRIASVKSTQKITSAMKMVAASKLRRAQAAAEEGRPYAEGMERMLGALAANMPSLDQAPKLLSGSGGDRVHLLVPITADRGLCGGYNASIARETRARIRALRGDGKEVKVLCIGRKGKDALTREFGGQIVDSIENATQKGADFGGASAIAERLVDMFEADEFDVCTLIYNRFKSAISQVMTPQQVIPFPVPEAPGDDDGGGLKALYIMEPSEEEILDRLLPSNLAVQVFRALLESYASEQGARMTAMDNATRNAGDMIDDLTLTYNRTRQAHITRELIEIISGAEAI